MPGMYCGVAVLLAGIAVLGPSFVRHLMAAEPRIRKIAFLAGFTVLFSSLVKASIWTGLDLRAACIECTSPTGGGLVLHGYPYPPPAHDPLRAHLILLLACVITGAFLLYRIIARPRRPNLVGTLAGIASAALAVPAFFTSVPTEGDAGVFIYLLIIPIFLAGQGVLLLLSLVLLVRTGCGWTPAC
jgi:hypothetical protein